MLKRTIYTLMGMMLVLILSNAASAQIRPNTIYVTPYLGGFMFDNEQNLHNRPVYGVGLGYNFTKYFGTELSTDYIYTKYDLMTPGSRSAHVGNYRLDAVLNLMPDSRLVPFVFAGLGGQSIDYPGNVHNKTKFAADYGAGLSYFFTDWMALRGDIRQIYVFDGAMKNIEFTVGMSFYFGGTPAPVSRYEPVTAPKPAPAAQIRPIPTPQPRVEESRVEERVIIVLAEPKVEEKVMAVAAEPKIIVLAFEDIHFDFDKSELKPEAKAILKRNIQILRNNPKAQIRLAGYTSASGTHEYNQKLSERRATAVQEYLVSDGIIAPDRLSTIGYGKTNPAEYEAAPKELYSDAAKANMRVLFEIVVQ